MAAGRGSRVGKRFEDIVSGRSGGDVLVSIWNTAPFLNTLAGVGLKDYYFDPALKLEVQLEFQDRFPEALCWPGVWADFGALCEPSAFGCDIDWPQGGGMPMAQPVIRSLSDLDAVRPIDPLKDGLLPRALDDYRYFWGHLDPVYIDEYGYLDGVAASFGPVELAAVLLGHAAFFLNLITEPEAVHRLLEITTESVLSWLKAHEPINGPLKRIAIADHIPGQVSREHFEEFWLPYTRRILAEFPEATFLYHNEYPIPYLDALAELDFDVFHFGGELAPVKAALGEKMTLMGNLHPVESMLAGSPERVKAEALACLDEGATGGRFLLSTAGGLAPDTPAENVAAMLEATADFLAERGR